MVASSHSLSYSQTKFFAYILLIYTSTMSSHSTTKFLPQSSFFYFFSKHKCSSEKGTSFGPFRCVVGSSVFQATLSELLETQYMETAYTHSSF